jgi:RND family efflux transporter MFP subunit
MVSSNMDISDKLKSLSIDRSTAVRSTGGWKLPALIAGGVALIVLAWVVFGRGNGPAETPVQPVAASTPSAAAAAPGATARPRGGLVASGYVVARRSATVSVDITGRLTDVLFEEGAVVEKGQILARLDADLARYDLQLARGRLQAANAAIASIEAQMVEAEAQRQRAEKLVSSGAVSAAAYDTAVSRIESLSAQQRAAVADAAVAQTAINRQAEFVERHIVRAPFAGVIIAKNAQAGEILSPAAGGGEFTRTGVATLVDMASLEVEVDVNEGQISDISAGQLATIVLDAYPDWQIAGEVIAIIPTANRDRATIQVRVGFKERDERVLPQMAAKVTFDRSAN